MKKCSSVVWQFFDRISEDGRCVAVLCKLCETQYKYFGNTTNLRSHLINKHPIQWDLSQSETEFRIEDDETVQSSPVAPKRRKYSTRTYKNKNVRYSISVDNNQDATWKQPKIEIQRVDVLENSDNDNEVSIDNEATANLVRQMHGDNSDEEWLEEDPYQISHFETFEPKRKKMKFKKIKREVTSPTPLANYIYTPRKFEKASPIIIDDSLKKDEYSIFGEYVANKLRKVKAPRTRGNLQQLITTILWQAEYGMYDSAEAVKRVLLYSVQQPEPEQSSVVQEFEAIQAEVIEQRDDEPNQSLEDQS